MILIDSHCHLDSLDLSGQTLDEVLAEARAQDVHHVLSICTRLDEFEPILAMAKKYPMVSASVGVHPSETIDVEPTVDELCQLAQDKEVVAIGECGLDYHYDSVARALQRERFETHLDAAVSCQKPVIIHTRSAQDDTLDLMHTHHIERAGGVMHCFTESVEMAKAALDMGMLISLSGIVTFKNAENVRDIARAVPLESLMVETDAPYLTPMPYRSKPNYPKYVRQTAEFLAELKGVSLAHLAEVTTANFSRLFGVEVSASQ